LAPYEKRKLKNIYILKKKLSGVNSKPDGTEGGGTVRSEGEEDMNEAAGVSRAPLSTHSPTGSSTLHAWRHRG